nr:aminotransferase class V-fold PLP-dependent enzyme [Salsipaludibacter albus]
MEAVEAARRDVAANPMRGYDREWFDHHARAVAAVAGLVGARPEDTTLVPNATVGMDVALRVLPWDPDTTIVCTDVAYPSVAANLVRRAAATGATIEVLATDPAIPEALPTMVAAALDRVGQDGPTGVVVDQFVSATATPLPVHDVVAAAHARGAVVVVDGAHVPGQVAPDRADVGADAWTGNLHKWACAPPALAALVVAERHHDRLGSVVSSWFDDEPFPGNSRWQGTVDPGPVLVAEQVVAQAVAILARADELEARARAGAEAVAEAVGGEVLPGAGWMRAVVLPDSAGPADDAGRRAIERGLWTRGIEAKVTPDHGRLVLRISTHAYTSDRDHDRLADVLGRQLGDA